MKNTVVVIVLLLLGAACGSGKEVGNSKLLDFDDEVQERLGEATPKPKATSAAVGTRPAKQSITTPAPAATEPPALIDIAIQSDAAGTAFDPPVVQIFVGSIARWTNNDTVGRSVEADDGTFASGLLAPGQKYSYEAKKVGKFNYHDGTRPYAVATLEVRE